MQSRYLSRHALVLCAGAALLAGCGGSQPPIGGPGVVPQTSPIAQRAAHRKSWMLPEAKNENLLYVSTSFSTVNVLSYPGLKRVGTLTGFGGAVGECVDSAQNVWVVNQLPAEVIKYAHGGKTPVSKLGDPGSYPYGCAVDPSSGNVAVANSDGTVAIFPQGQGSPTTYSVSTAVYYCAYDDNGDLFVSRNESSLRELPKGGDTFQDFTVTDELIKGLVSLQWIDGHLVASQRDDDGPGTLIYRIKVKGSTGRVVQSTTLSNRAAKQYVQFWVQGDTIIGPADNFRRFLELWEYPQGGKAKKVEKKVDAWGVVISLTSSRSPSRH